MKEKHHTEAKPKIHVCNAGHVHIEFGHISLAFDINDWLDIVDEAEAGIHDMLERHPRNKPPEGRA